MRNDVIIVCSDEGGSGGGGGGVVVVVVVWFGDPCESPGALLLKAAPGDSRLKDM